MKVKRKKKGERFTENIVGLLFSKRPMMALTHFYMNSLCFKTVTIKEISKKNISYPLSMLLKYFIPLKVCC